MSILLYGLIGPFAGAMRQRLGVRRTTVLAMGMLSVGVALATLVREPWQLILVWGVVVGLGSGMAAMVLGATVVNRWFVERRGLALGILTASAATGQLVFLPMLASVIDRHGWRWAVQIVAGAAALTISMIALLMREHPADVGLEPLGADESCVAPTPSRANPAMVVLLALMGMFDLVGTTGSGWLSDRWSSQWLLAWFYSLRGLGLMFLPYALGGTQASLWVFAVWFGLDWIATVPPTVKLTTDAFGAVRARSCSGGLRWVISSVRQSRRSAPGGFERRWATTASRSGQPASFASEPRCSRWASAGREAMRSRD